MKRKILQLAVVFMCLVSAGLFAGTLWDQADAIADSSSHILPAVTDITFMETSEYGIAVTEQKAISMMDESRTGRLTSRFFGDSALEELMRSYSDGLIFTPFSSWVEEFTELEATGTITQINGETCEEYYYETTVDENGLFYHYYGVEAGKTIDFSGYVWISLNSGAPLKIENSYSIGNLDVTQTLHFTEEDGMIIPEMIITNGSEYKTAGAYGILEQTDFTIEERVNEVFSASKYSR